MLARKRENYYLTFRGTIAILTFLFVVGMGRELLAKDFKACTKTAKVAYKAGINEALDDYWIAVGNCYNLSDPEARADCLKTAKEELKEAKEECKDQR